MQLNMYNFVLSFFCIEVFYFSCSFLPYMFTWIIRSWILEAMIKMVVLHTFLTGDDGGMF